MKKLVELLIDKGYPPSIAKVVVYLLEAKGTMTSSREIEKGIDARQPEVNTAIKALIEKKWVVGGDEKQAGPTGRPTKMYRINYAPLLTDLEKNMGTDMMKWKDLITEIRAMMVVKESVQPETPHVLGKQQSLDHLRL